jgi:AP-4 complex subunit epsilon-1
MSNSSSSHLSKELLELVKSIGESRSKQEEDKIITAEAQSLKTKFLERNLPEKKMKELLIRALYVEMLGHDASFSYIHAVNLS